MTKWLANDHREVRPQGSGQNRTLLFLPFCFLALTAQAADTTFWVEPCSILRASCQASDADLARWALEAWAQASTGRLHFVETKDRTNALIRVRWADKDSGLYGEAVPIVVNGHRGAELHILVPEPAKDDPLLRDTIVYLTCLHESGHAMGLAHTRGFADIMYNFQYGGDIAEYFGRYRRLLMKREDIAKNPGMSPADRDALGEAIKNGRPPGN
jgi:hypothetical protein